MQILFKLKLPAMMALCLLPVMPAFAHGDGDSLSTTISSHYPAIHNTGARLVHIDAIGVQGRMLPSEDQS
ncbi:hypothetical protein [Thermoflavifilum thermophilum]|uniref:Uncharacterized protein n=1 Tax=Thermoflavifilum thermophilum TaxID=1393122 RepID=A0A1I7MZN7_9BACT|nr:hypothetical protein [Thermoflavifilum thermophilum]SFV27897.1 hypothetical protein SAMN05660895_0210 [Thermoflavifilum thermophilum]